MATSGSESEMNTSSEMLEPEKVVPVKKKKQGFMGKVRGFFSRKRTKSKDFSKSTSELPQSDQDQSQAQLSNTDKQMSMSADSIFNQEPSKSTTNGDGIKKTPARSMETIGFADELKSRVSRRVIDPDDDDDDVLPSSPLQDTDTSMASMDSTEDDINMTASFSYTNPNKSSLASPTRSDLDVVASSGSLDVSLAKSKRNIGPKNKRASKARRTQSPNTTLSLSANELPLVEEESKEPEQEENKENKDSNEKKVIVIAKPEKEEKVTPLKTQEKVETKKEVPEVEKEPVKKSNSLDTKSEPMPTQEDSKPKSEVVMRPKSGKNQDLTKRQTVAAVSNVKTETSLFGPRKIAKRTSAHENINWEDLESQKEKPKVEESSSASEFSEMVKRVRKNSAKNNEPEKKVVKDIDIESEPKGNKVPLKKVELEKKDSIKKTEEPKSTEIKTETNKLPSAEKKVVFSPRKDEDKMETEEKKPVAKEEPKKVVVIEKKENKEVETKPNVVKTEPSTSDTKSSNAFKRESPLSKNRVRSMTLPENIPPPEKKEEVTSSSAAIKRTKSQRNDKPSPVQEESTGGQQPAGGQPSWIALARKKTKVWGKSDDDIEEKENQSVQKDTPSKENDLNEPGNRKSNVLDMVKHWNKG